MRNHKGNGVRELILVVGFGESGGVAVKGWGMMAVAVGWVWW